MPSGCPRCSRPSAGNPKEEFKEQIIRYCSKTPFRFVVDTAMSSRIYWVIVLCVPFSFPQMLNPMFPRYMEQLEGISSMNMYRNLGCVVTAVFTF